MSPSYTPAVSQILAAQGQRYAYPPEASKTTLIHRHFTVANEMRALQAPAWRDYVGRFLDVPLTKAHLAGGFRGEIDTYILPDMIYLDSRTDPVAQIRTLSRISTDNVRDFVFHVAVEGIIETATGMGWQRKSAQFMPGILALDLNQPMHMVRPTYARVLAFFLPRAMVEAEIPDAESVHGRVIGYTSPLTQLLLKQLNTLCRHLPSLAPAEAERIIRNCAQLIVAAFAKQARLGDSARTAAYAAAQNEIRAYVEANLHRETLSPESVLRAFQLPRATLYRMFEQEGGLGAYIRHCRLRTAAAELAAFPKTPVMEIAYSLCFNSASDFTRAFRRAYGMSPQDFRALAADMTLLHPH